jgi:DNA polymerase
MGEKKDLEKYLRQQMDLGFEEVYLPFASKFRIPTASKEKPRPPATDAGQFEKSESLGGVTMSPGKTAEEKPIKTSAKTAGAAPKSARKELPALPIEQFEEARTLDQLERTIKDCRLCQLWKERTNFVFGVGDPDADILFIGEAPGREEDLQGIPFVGRAGKLLDKMLVEVGLRREDVYIANILKSRPPGNRDPQPDEVEACEPYLHMQIKLIKPKVICSLGRIAAQTLLKTKMTLGEMRGRWFDYCGTKLMVTYHPAAILRAMDNYSRSIEDLKRLLKELEK